MTLTVDEVLAQRREAASRQLVIVGTPGAAEAMRLVVAEGVRVVVLGTEIPQGRFETVILLAPPRTSAEADWWRDEILMRLAPRCTIYGVVGIDG